MTLDRHATPHAIARHLTCTNMHCAHQANKDMENKQYTDEKEVW